MVGGDGDAAEGEAVSVEGGVAEVSGGVPGRGCAVAAEEDGCAEGGSKVADGRVVAGLMPCMVAPT